MRALVLSAALVAAVGLSAVADPVFAAGRVPQVFPVSSGLVAVVVAAVFVLPALLAAVVSGLSRLGRGLGSTVGFGLLAALIVAALWLDPEWAQSLRI